jgi:hypothetical protein
LEGLKAGWLEGVADLIALRAQAAAGEALGPDDLHASQPSSRLQWLGDALRMTDARRVGLTSGCSGMRNVLLDWFVQTCLLVTLAIRPHLAAAYVRATVAVSSAAALLRKVPGLAGRPEAISQVREGFGRCAQELDDVEHDWRTLMHLGFEDE